MPGKRFNFKITRGPWKGKRARIIMTAATKGNLLLDIQGVTLPEGGIPSLPAGDIRAITNKTPRHTRRHHKESKPHDPRKLRAARSGSRSR